MLADLHMHMLLDSVYWRDAISAHRPRPDDGIIRHQLAAYRGIGVTFLRDGGDRFGVCLRAKVLAAEYGITLRTPAFPICKRGHYGSFIGRSWERFADYQALLDEAEAAGADFIKLMVSGLMDFSHFGVLTEEPLSAVEIRDLTAAAHDRGFAVMAHCNGARATESAALAGVDSIEHGAYLDDAACHALAECGTVWIPTLSTIGNLMGSGRHDDGVLHRILVSAQENVRRTAALGGLVGLGSDAGALRVPHAEGTVSEEHWLRQALGDDADIVLPAAEKRIREHFQRQRCDGAAGRCRKDDVSLQPSGEW